MHDRLDDDYCKNELIKVGLGRDVPMYPPSHTVFPIEITSPLLEALVEQIHHSVRNNTPNSTSHVAKVYRLHPPSSRTVAVDVDCEPHFTDTGTMIDFLVPVDVVKQVLLASKFFAKTDVRVRNWRQPLPPWDVVVKANYQFRRF
jgi:hypothetical protein